jgi:hypothetical protein
MVFRVSKVCVPCAQVIFRPDPFRDPICFSLLCHLSTHKGFSTTLSFVEHLLIRGRTSVPRIASFRASSAFDIFESGFRSLELTLFGPAAPLSYSFRASSAFDIFESGLRSLELTLFGPAAPLSYSFRAGSAFDIFESGLRSLELISFGPAAPSTYSSWGSCPSN